MAHSVVALEPCLNYEINTVRRAVGRLWDSLPDSENLPIDGRNVLIKINHLGRHRREAAIVTDPAVTGALAELLREHGARVAVGDGLEVSGDSPYRKSAYAELAESFGFDLLNFKDDDYVEVPNPLGGAFPSFHVSRYVLEADLVLNFAKLKTHVLTLFTGAVKNAYGYLPLGLRRTLHQQFPIPRDFARTVVDIFMTRVPALSLMDAVVALSGDGPGSGGRPHKVGLLLGSTDAVALDAVACRLIGLAPEAVPTLAHARELGLGVIDESDIEILGGPLQGFRPAGFALPKTSSLLSFVDRLPPLQARALEKVLASTRRLPVVRRAACIGCGLCEAHCPRGAVTVTDGIARINYASCISCFCCQEFCESDAITVHANAAFEFIGQTASALAGIRKSVRRVFGRRT